ncbi:MAG: GGDEF domain-containing protein [Erysipelotrichaceae bacterium]
MDYKVDFSLGTYVKKYWERFILNNGHFKKTDILYREVYFINVLLMVAVINSLYFTFLNYFILDKPLGVYINLLAALLSLGLIVFFHTTNNYRITSLALVMMFVTILVIIITSAGFKNYTLIWSCFVPPLVYSLLGSRKAVHIIRAFLVYLFFIIFLNFYHWKSEGFNFESIQNIFGVLVCTMITMRYFVKSRNVALEILEEKNLQLEKASNTDRLTNIYNRTKIDKILEDEILRASRGGHPFSLVMIDIDHFKSINDRFGHIIGDQYLKMVAQIMRDTCRQLDSVCRWGGEEFLIVCPETDVIGATTLANKLLKTIRDYPFESDKSITFSIGVSTYKPLDSEDSLILRADKALYLAKNNGRNRVETVDSLTDILD